MKNTKSNFTKLKFKTQQQFEQFLLENSTKAILKQLEDNGIEPSAVSEEEMNTLIAEEMEKQKEFSKGIASGAAGVAVLLGLLG